MKVKAKVDGFYGGSRRRAGSTFEFKGSKPGSWMVPVEEAKPAAAPKALRSATKAPTPEAEKPAGEELI
jgi:hypothetical protein